MVSRRLEKPVLLRYNACLMAIPAKDFACLLLVSWRGHDGTDAPEHLVMGQVMTKLLDLVRIPHRTVRAEALREDVGWAGQVFMSQRIPVALLVPKGVLS